MSKWWQNKLRQVGWQWSKDLKCYYSIQVERVKYTDTAVAWGWRTIDKYSGRMSIDHEFKTLIENRLSKINKRRNTVAATHKGKRTKPTIDVTG